MNMSLRTKVLVSVGLIVFLVLGISTFVHIQDLKQDYLEAVEWRSEALAESLLKGAPFIKMLDPSSDIPVVLRSLSYLCADLYSSQQEKNVTHVAIIDEAETIATHNNMDFWDRPVEEPLLLDALEQRSLVTVLVGDIYHTLIPIVGTLETYVGTIDIGFPKEAVDEKVKEILSHTIGLFLVFVILACCAIFVLMQVLLTKPVKRLVDAGKMLAQGNASQTFYTKGRNDEMTAVGVAFSQIAVYLQHVTTLASHIAHGMLDGNDIQPRSEDDTLGKAIQDMLHYLWHIQELATNISRGDLTGNVQLHSKKDGLGQAIHTMTKGLRALIFQIRESGEQIADTGNAISSMAEQDIAIVKQVHSSAEEVTSTMRQMGASIEEVAHNMETLSSSVEETSASVAQMSSSISHIASNANQLTEQTHRTIHALRTTVSSLEGVADQTEMSKELSQGTMQDALNGQEAVEQVMSSMETINHTVTTAVEAITRFERRSREINTILDVIREITEQTSLLALNASIIAAQAGIHGRGFAVVADEIKNLASGVATSTKDIAAIVQSLQQDTNEVVQTIHEGAKDVGQGIERTQQAQEVLQNIIKSAQQSSTVVTNIADTLQTLMTSSRDVSASMEQVSLMTVDITAATNEQQMTTEQINQVIVHINDRASEIQKATAEQSDGVRYVLEAIHAVGELITQNLESSQNIEQTTGALSKQAQILLHSVAQFKLEEA